MFDGQCRVDSDPALFDTERPPGESQGQVSKRLKAAKNICLGGCPVVTQCLGYALTHDITFGIWGGTDPGQRSKLALRAARRDTT